jgi:hypothetical protein
MINNITPDFDLKQNARFERAFPFKLSRGEERTKIEPVTVSGFALVGF